ncbi:HNH endonuclease [Miniphocaeibacter massiliensis]|uniref:HNH endonuclease n=1 Tax=Miniphocaeibacter massiliensis TaxID=2041841 RepID=UPI000C1BE7D5|nr:HNH endonuclease [Miniphocaeibacter massiliensis]
MPRKPAKPCAFPGCPELVHERYCDKHKKETGRHYEKYKRDPKTKKRYGYRWKKIRDKYIKSHTLCEQCKKEERIKTAEEVHHIVPLSKGGTHDEENLMALCKSCHSRITALEGDRWRRS